MIAELVSAAQCQCQAGGSDSSSTPAATTEAALHKPCTLQSHLKSGMQSTVLNNRTSCSLQQQPPLTVLLLLLLLLFHGMQVQGVLQGQE